MLHEGCRTFFEALILSSSSSKADRIATLWKEMNCPDYYTQLLQKRVTAHQLACEV